MPFDRRSKARDRQVRKVVEGTGGAQNKFYYSDRLPEDGHVAARCQWHREFNGRRTSCCGLAPEWVWAHLRQPSRPSSPVPDAPGAGARSCARARASPWPVSTGLRYWSRTTSSRRSSASRLVASSGYLTKACPWLQGRPRWAAPNSYQRLAAGDTARPSTRGKVRPVAVRKSCSQWNSSIDRSPRDR